MTCNDLLTSDLFVRCCFIMCDIYTLWINEMEFHCMYSSCGRRETFDYIPPSPKHILTCLERDSPDSLQQARDLMITEGILSLHAICHPLQDYNFRSHDQDTFLTLPFG